MPLQHGHWARLGLGKFTRGPACGKRLASGVESDVQLSGQGRVRDPKQPSKKIQEIRRTRRWGETARCSGLHNEGSSKTQKNPDKHHSKQRKNSKT